VRKLIPIFILIFVVACNKTSTSYLSDSRTQDINQTITLSAPPLVNPLKVNDFVGLEIQNNVENQIKLSDTYGVKIMRMKENQWSDFLTITDAYSALSPATLAPKSQEGFNSSYVSFIPNIKIEAPETFRFMVKGINESTNQEVYAYIDLKLSP
jgi:hypothetical protein